MNPRFVCAIALFAAGATSACEQDQWLQRAANEALQDANVDAHVDANVGANEPLDAASSADSSLAPLGTPEVIARNVGAVLSLALSETLVFFASENRIGAVDKNGGKRVELATETAGIGGLCLESDQLYWTVLSARTEPGDTSSNGMIKASSAFGTGTAGIAIAGLSSPFFVLADKGRLFWTDTARGVFALDKGSQSARKLAASSELPGSLAMTPERLYWVNHFAGTLVSVSKTGGDPQLLVEGPGAQSISGIAVDEERIYWLQNEADSYFVKAMPLGGGPSETIATSAQTGSLITVDEESVYWTTLAGAALLRAPKRGGASSFVAVTVQNANLRGGAVTHDKSHVYWSSGDGTLWRVRVR